MEENKGFELEIKIAELEKQIDELNIKAESCTTYIEFDELSAECKKLKAERNSLIKEQKNLYREKAEKTKFQLLPLGIKIHFILSCIFYFPILSWSLLPLWKKVIEICYGWFGKALSNIESNFLYFLFCGLIWFLLPIIGLIVTFCMLKERKKTTDKKTFYWIFGISLCLIVLMLIYQIFQLLFLFRGTI